jgi:hypothetical protein
MNLHPLNQVHSLLLDERLVLAAPLLEIGVEGAVRALALGAGGLYFLEAESSRLR